MSAIRRGSVLILGSGQKPMTSRRRAEDFVARGLAAWVELGRSIRFRDTLRVVQERQEAAEALRAVQQAREEAGERGGVELRFQWGVTKVRVAGAPGWLPRELGYSVLGAQVSVSDGRDS